MTRYTTGLAVSTALAVSLLGSAPSFAQTAGTVAFLMPDQASTRYEEHDFPGFKAEMAKLCKDCKVIYQNATADVALQQQQFNSAITQGAKVIVLDPRIQGKHLKRWTLSGMIRTDLRERAIPWMHLLIERNETITPGPLNLHWRQKLLTVSSCLALLLLAVAAMTLDSRWLLPVSVLAGVIVLGDLALFAWFSRARGPLFASAAVPLRWAFYVVSGVGAAWAIVTHRWHPRHPPPAPLREVARAQAPEI